MKSLFRSRVPPPLDTTQLDRLSTQCHLPKEDIEEWYDRFNHCYPRGLSYKEFLFYLQQVQTQHASGKRPAKSMIKRLFRLLDLDEDKQLNFEEFFVFNILVNQGLVADKLKLILSLYDKDKKKHLTRRQLEKVLISMFDLLDIPKPQNGLTQRIDTILSRANFNAQSTKISWHTFSTHVLNDSSLFNLLISKEQDGDDSDDDFSALITRF
jgi:Ca2+-binding EF-hand superfamily protein